MNNNLFVRVVGDNCIESLEKVDSTQIAYYYAVFSKPFKSYVTWKDSILSNDSEQNGGNIGALVTFDTEESEEIMVKIGVSFIDMAQAKKNLEIEIPYWDFDKVRNDAKDVWNDALNKIQIEGGTNKQKTVFYSALYRVLLGSQTLDRNEYGRYYSRFDKRVHDTDGQAFYQVGSNWGSHHSLFPLVLLLEPEIQNDIMRSYVRMQDEGNWLVNSGGRRNMIGRHEVATITDTYMKNTQVLVTPKKSNITKAEQMKGKVLGAQEGSSGYDTFTKQPEVLQDIVKNNDATLYASFNEAFIDLEHGRIDGLLVDNVYAGYYLKQAGTLSDYNIIETPYTQESFAVGVRKGDDKLAEKINEGLKTLKENGKYDEIVEKWFGDEATSK